MNAFFFLIPISLALGVAGLVVFLWSLRDGQYEDLDGAAMRVLLDEESGPLPDSKPGGTETSGRRLR